MSIVLHETCTKVYKGVEIRVVPRQKFDNCKTVGTSRISQSIYSTPWTKASGPGSVDGIATGYELGVSGIESSTFYKSGQSVRIFTFGHHRGTGQLCGSSRGSGQLCGSSRGTGQLCGSSPGTGQLCGSSRGTGQLCGSSRGTG